MSKYLRIIVVSFSGKFPDYFLRNVYLQAMLTCNKWKTI